MLNEDIKSFIEFIKSKDGIGNKSALIEEVQKIYKLTKDRSIYYTKNFSVRFSYSSSKTFSNTVISLSNLQKFDHLPFFVCLVTPKQNILYLSNSTFLQKVSHSSQQLRINNIRGSINGSDIVKTFENLSNTPENFEKLFSIHSELGFDGNLVRLVEATNNISPSGIKFNVLKKEKSKILSAPSRAKEFIKSKEYLQLKKELDTKVNQHKNEILIASFIENINIRGRIIEYLIAGEDKKLQESLIQALHNSNRIIPNFQTQNNLGDYIKIFEKFNSATDVKTKIMLLNSNPKGYNIDKVLEFLSKDNTVFMFYFIGIEPNKIVNQILLSMFQSDLLKSTILLKHWSGRNSRGVTQFRGDIIHDLLLSPINTIINEKESMEFLNILINL